MHCITFTKGNDVYVSKEFTRILGLPEKKLLFHFEEGKMRVSTTDTEAGFQVIFNSGMTRVREGRHLSKFMFKEKGIEPGTRIAFYDESVEGYYIEKVRTNTKTKSKSATNNQ